MNNIAIAGTGYVGLVTGVCLAEKGNNVICLDIDPKKIALMKSAVSPIYEPGLDELMQRNIEAGRLHFTTDYNDAYKNADFIFIGVGTPERADGSANLDYVFEVARQIADSILKDCIIVVKSTVPIGTNEKVEQLINENLKHKVKIHVASNPEFLAQGTAVVDTLKPSRIVVGTEAKEAELALKELFSNFNAPMIFTNRRGAEMIKYASNNFLALKISYINEIANACELLGVDVEDVAKGMSYDERIGNKFLHAGCGYGGSCFPKDTKALYQLLLDDYGYELKAIKAAIDINERQKLILVQKAKKVFKSLKNLKIAVLGLTFKPGTDDVREAPSLKIVPELINAGAHITAYDPVGAENFKRVITSDIKYAESPQEALIGADACFILTEWNEIKAVKVEEYVKLMKKPIVFDGRNIFCVDEVKELEYYSIGR